MATFVKVTVMMTTTTMIMMTMMTRVMTMMMTTATMIMMTLMTRVMTRVLTMMLTMMTTTPVRFLLVRSLLNAFSCQQCSCDRVQKFPPPLLITSFSYETLDDDYENKDHI